MFIKIGIKSKVEFEPNRKGFGRGLLGSKHHDNIVACCADLTESTQMHLFEAFPERFVEIGSRAKSSNSWFWFGTMGKILTLAVMLPFSPGENWEQIRTTICLNDQPVRIIGSHAGG